MKKLLTAFLALTLLLALASCGGTPDAGGETTGETQPPAPVGTEEPTGTGEPIPPVGTETDDGKEHTRSGETMDPGTLIDDGGEIKVTPASDARTVVRTAGEHRIVIGENKACYTLTGTTEATWSNSGSTFNRVRCNAPAELTFSMDFSGAADRTKVGCVITLIAVRAHTCISVSADGENWTDIGYAEGDGIHADLSVHVNELLGKSVSDANLYQCWYALGDYLPENGKLYVKCHSSDAYGSNLSGDLGTDVIGYVSYFEYFEVVNEAL